MSSSGLAVVEGHWYKDWPMSVAPLVELALANDNIRADGYDYERCRTKSHFLEALARASRHAKLIYVASHGSKTGVDIGKELVEVASLCEALQGSTTLQGVLFGVCDFLTPNNAQALLDNTDVKWVAGYQASVDWADSAAIDMIFIAHWLGVKNKPINGGDELAELMRTMGRFLQEHLRFVIYRKGPRGLQNLLEPSV